MFRFLPILWDTEFGITLLLASILAGLASSLVNGMSDRKTWERAAKAGGWCLIASIFYTIVAILRSIVLGIFGGMVAGYILYKNVQYPESVIIGIASLAAFLSDPALFWLKSNGGAVTARLVNRVLGKETTRDGSELG